MTSNDQPTDDDILKHGYRPNITPSTTPTPPRGPGLLGPKQQPKPQQDNNPA